MYFVDGELTSPKQTDRKELVGPGISVLRPVPGDPKAARLMWLGKQPNAGVERHMDFSETRFSNLAASSFRSL